MESRGRNPSFTRERSIHSVSHRAVNGSPGPGNGNESMKHMNAPPPQNINQNRPTAGRKSWSNNRDVAEESLQQSQNQNQNHHNPHNMMHIPHGGPPVNMNMNMNANMNPMAMSMAPPSSLAHSGRRSMGGNVPSPNGNSRLHVHVKQPNPRHSTGANHHHNSHMNMMHQNQNQNQDGELPDWKKQWNTKDIPQGMVRNNPFVPPPPPPPNVAPQLMHQKKQWDTREIPRGNVASRVMVNEGDESSSKGQSPQRQMQMQMQHGRNHSPGRLQQQQQQHPSHGRNHSPGRSMMMNGGAGPGGHNPRFRTHSPVQPMVMRSHSPTPGSPSPNPRFTMEQRAISGSSPRNMGRPFPQTSPSPSSSNNTNLRGRLIENPYLQQHHQQQQQQQQQQQGRPQTFEQPRQSLERPMEPQPPPQQYSMESNWQPSKEIPKGTVKGRQSLFSGGSPSHGNASSANSGPDMVSGLPHKKSNDSEEEDPWIIPSRTNNSQGRINQGQFITGDWGEAASPAKSTDTDETTDQWEQPGAAGWFKSSESQSETTASKISTLGDEDVADGPPPSSLLDRVSEHGTTSDQVYRGPPSENGEQARAQQLFLDEKKMPDQESPSTSQMATRKMKLAMAPPQKDTFISNNNNKSPKAFLAPSNRDTSSYNPNAVVSPTNKSENFMAFAESGSACSPRNNNKASDGFSPRNAFFPSSSRSSGAFFNDQQPSPRSKAFFNESSSQATFDSNFNAPSTRFGFEDNTLDQVEHYHDDGDEVDDTTHATAPPKESSVISLLDSTASKTFLEPQDFVGTPSVSHYDEPPPVQQEEKAAPSRNHFHFEDDDDVHEREAVQPPARFDASPRTEHFDLAAQQALQSPSRQNAIQNASPLGEHFNLTAHKVTHIDGREIFDLTGLSSSPPRVAQQPMLRSPSPLGNKPYSYTPDDNDGDEPQEEQPHHQELEQKLHAPTPEPELEPMAAIEISNSTGSGSTMSKKQRKGIFKFFGGGNKKDGTSKKEKKERKDKEKRKSGGGFRKSSPSSNKEVSLTPRSNIEPPLKESRKPNASPKVENKVEKKASIPQSSSSGSATENVYGPNTTEYKAPPSPQPQADTNRTTGFEGEGNPQQIYKKKSEDDTTISDMTLPTVFKDARSPRQHVVSSSGLASPKFPTRIEEERATTIPREASSPLHSRTGGSVPSSRANAVAPSPVQADYSPQALGHTESRTPRTDHRSAPPPQEPTEEAPAVDENKPSDSFNLVVAGGHFTGGLDAKEMESFQDPYFQKKREDLAAAAEEATLKSEDDCADPELDHIEMDDEDADPALDHLDMEQEASDSSDNDTELEKVHEQAERVLEQGEHGSEHLGDEAQDPHRPPTPLEVLRKRRLEKLKKDFEEANERNKVSDEEHESPVEEPGYLPAPPSIAESKVSTQSKHSRFFAHRKARMSPSATSEILKAAETPPTPPKIERTSTDIKAFSPPPMPRVNEQVVVAAVRVSSSQSVESTPPRPVPKSAFMAKHADRHEYRQGRKKQEREHQREKAVEVLDDSSKVIETDSGHLRAMKKDYEMRLVKAGYQISKSTPPASPARPSATRSPSRRERSASPADRLRAEARLLQAGYKIAKSTPPASPARSSAASSSSRKERPASPADRLRARYSNQLKGKSNLDQDYYPQDSQGLATASTASDGSLGPEMSNRSERTNDSSVGSDIRVLRSILRRPRRSPDSELMGRPPKPVFASYDDKDLDPMQRAGLRLLSAAIIPIQTEVRRFIAMRRALTRMWALIVIQTYSRRWMTRRKYLQEVKCITTVQALVRGRDARNEMIYKHVCAIEIQRFVRGYLSTMRVYEEIYKVTMVQSFVRQKQAVDEAMYRMAFVIQLQAVARNWLTRRRLAYAQVCATAIQANWRCFFTRLGYQFDLLDIIIVQSIWRKRVATREVVKLRHATQTVMVTKIQARWRSYDCTMNYLHYLADILIVQSALRRYIATKRANKIRFENAQVIQTAWRGYVCRKDLKEYYAARRLQSVWRGFVSYADYMFTIADIVIAQKMVRSWFARRARHKLAYAKEHEAASIIQRSWRVCRSTKIIQRAWRSHRFRKQRLVCRSAKKLQRAWRLRRLRKLRQNAATAIQTSWRAYRSAKIIQRVWRLYRFRMLRQNAATDIQTSWRSYVDATEFVVMKYEFAAARTIQSSWRRFWYFSNFVIALDCTIQIQAIFRGHAQRRKIDKMHAAAIWIQSGARVLLAKQEANNRAMILVLASASKTMAARDNNAATKIQTAVRGGEARFALKQYQSVLRLHQSAKHIQRMWRGYTPRVMHILYIAARKIQSSWRCKNLEFKFKNYRASVVIQIKHNRASVVIQTFWRCKSLHRQYLQYSAALKIQKKWRSVKAREEVLMYRGESLAATMIQSAWRGFVCYTDYIFTIADIVAVQKLARGCIVRKKYAAELVALGLERRSSTKIQKVCRAYMARQRYWYTLGCTMQIQSWMRGRLVILKLHRVNAARVKLQSCARRYLARQIHLQRRFIYNLVKNAQQEQNKKIAALLIQDCARLFLEGKRRDRAACIIQRFFLMVKREVDLMVRATKRKQMQKKRMKIKHDKDEDALLEDAWISAVSGDINENDVYRKSSGGYAPHESRSRSGSSGGSVGPRSRSHSRSGSVDSRQSKSKGIMNRGEDQQRNKHSVPELSKRKIRLPPGYVKPSTIVRLHHDDDQSVFSGLTASSANFHVRVIPSRMKALSTVEIDEDLELEEAFIDAEICSAKERRMNDKQSSQLSQRSVKTKGTQVSRRSKSASRPPSELPATMA